MHTWTEHNNALHKTFAFSGFPAALEWMQKASLEIEKLNHHPKWTNIYNKVIVELTTHDAGKKNLLNRHRLSPNCAVDLRYNHA